VQKVKGSRDTTYTTPSKNYSSATDRNTGVRQTMPEKSKTQVINTQTADASVYKTPGTSFTVTCSKCKQTGHYANQCTNPSVKLTHLKKRNNDDKPASNNIQESTPYTVPVVINGYETSGLIDTGADRTFISQSLCDQLGIRTTELHGIINTAHPGITIPRVGITEPVQLKTGHTEFTTSCEILEQGHEFPIIVGRDIIPRMKIDILGLPFSYPPVLQTEVDNEDKRDRDERRSSAEAVSLTDLADTLSPEQSMEKSKLINSVEDLLQVNASIPVHAACPLPEAIVKLPTPPGIKEKSNPILLQLTPEADKVNPPIGKSSKGAEDSLECIPLARRELLQNQHLLGHFGVKAMVDGLKQNGHSWENMYKDALAVAQKCIPCLKYNVSPKFYHSLKTITAIEYTNEIVNLETEDETEAHRLRIKYMSEVLFPSINAITSNSTGKMKAKFDEMTDGRQGMASDGEKALR
ncbi:hypothetical protein BB560_006825, partial [Smittium megazygosporum]